MTKGGKLISKHRFLVAISGAILVSQVGQTGIPALADSKPAEWAKYFNPIQKKSYVNKSQDREIKKKAFKGGDLPNTKPIPNKEVGLFAEVSTSDWKDADGLEKLLDNPRIAGLSLIIPWTSLERSEEQYDWKPLDDIIAACKKKEKSLILRVSTCGLEANDSDSDTPGWVYTAGVKSITYKDKDGKDHKMPIFWDTVYLAKWSNFVQALGARYDKNATLHSVGITGGGMLGSTLVVPDFLHDKNNYDKLEGELNKEHGMSQRQLVGHWKYVADLFPKAFPTARLNFDIDPPTPNRAGQDTLDEISDYLVFRYGQRIYLTRENIGNAKHGFDEYRVLLKFKSDTFTGYQLTDGFTDDDWQRLTKNALDDGVSFVEVPKKYLTSDDKIVQDSLSKLQEHLGYQLVLQSADFNRELKSGQALKASISILNVGSSSPKASSRQLDKDVPGSYQVGFEVRDASGKPIVISVQTPPTPTTKWLGNKPVAWEEEYKMSHLKPGEYSVYVCVIDKQSKRKLQLLDGTKDGTDKPEQEVALGKITVSSE